MVESNLIPQPILPTLLPAGLAVVFTSLLVPRQRRLQRQQIARRAVIAARQLPTTGSRPVRSSANGIRVTP